jgi:hypothetical protein
VGELSQLDPPEPFHQIAIRPQRLAVLGKALQYQSRNKDHP